MLALLGPGADWMTAAAMTQGFPGAACFSKVTALPPAPGQFSGRQRGEAAPAAEWARAGTWGCVPHCIVGYSGLPATGRQASVGAYL